MNRRNFLRALGVGGSTSALSACGLDDNRYYTPIENVLPYIVKPEQVTPGTPTFFATSVTTGPTAWPVLAVHREGRVVNVMANRTAPVPAAVPTEALLELQRHYAPDRLKGPTIGGEATTWEEGLGKLAGAIRAAKDTGKKVVWLGGYRSGTIVDVIRAVCTDAVFWEPLGRDAESAAMSALFGTPRLPRYDLSGAHYVLSFGADFLGGRWGGAATQASFAAARDSNQGQFLGRFATVGPHRDQTGAKADDWYAVVPGTEAHVAAAVAKLVAAKNGYRGIWLDWIASFDVAAAAAASGLTEEVLLEIADRFVSSPGAIALPGGTSGASPFATELAMAVYFINHISQSSGFHPDGYEGPISRWSDVEALIADMKAGKVGVLLIDDHCNPVYSTPAEAAFAEALSSVGLTVGLSSHPSETGAKCAASFPINDGFEDWGDEALGGGLRLLRQPSMTSLVDSRSVGDILLAVYRPTGDMPVLASTWHAHLQQAWTATWAVAAPPPSAAPEQGADAPNPTASPAMARAWESALQRGFEVVASSTAWGEGIPGSFSLGTPSVSDSGDLHLHVYTQPFLLDGRYSNEPWAQEVPDPMTGQVWDSWALMHPDTAARLGVGDNDLVSIRTDKGQIEVGIEVHRFVRPDTVAVAFGGGHTGAGRYAEGVGVNVVSLLGVVRDASGCLAWQQARCQVTSAGKKASLVSTFGSDDHLGRGWVEVVPAAALVSVGDAANDVPGSMVARHILPLDPRLIKAGISDFYMMPEHPTYRFGMSIDTDACTGCGACAIACYAENNLPVIGKDKVAQGREMGWVRVNRYIDGDDVHFVPMMCQQCGHAPCESVCPVLATYHTIDGLNAMIYNRCVGTRYCSNACPYGARRFNYHSYVWPEPFNLQLNPDVATRTMGVMEKCTFCVQRIRRVKDAYRDRGFSERVPDAALRQLPACADACPSQAITFGNLNDEASTPSRTRKSARNYYPIPEINTFPAINYLARASFHAAAPDHGGPGAAEHGAPPDHHPAGGDTPPQTH